MKKVMMLSSVALTCGLAVAGLNEALVFDMGLVPGEGAMTTSRIYNRLTHAAVERHTVNALPDFRPARSPFSDPVPEQMKVVAMDVPTPLFPANVRSENVLVFPQPDTVHEGELYTFYQGMRIKNLPMTSEVTVYCRFYIDSTLNQTLDSDEANSTIVLFDSNRNPNDSTGKGGWQLVMRQEYGALKFWLRYGARKCSWGDDNFLISSDACGKWIDLALVFSTNAAKDATYVNLYGRLDGGKFNCSDANHSEEKPFLLTDGSDNGVLIDSSDMLDVGSAQAYVGWNEWTKITKKSDRGTFRGGISQLKVYNRSLTMREVYGLFDEANGGNIEVGTRNGKADEFAMDADQGIAEVFDPLTMPSVRLRGKLTAEHPSVAVEYVTKCGAGAGINRLLRLTPVLGELDGGSSEVTVSVNGTAVGTMDLARQTTFLVTGKDNLANDNGRIVYSFTRTGDVRGALGIDAIEIGGAWQMGVPGTADRAADETGVFTVWKDEPHKTTFFADSQISHPTALGYVSQTVWGPKYGTGEIINPATTLHFCLPDGVEKFRGRYTFGFQFAPRYSENAYPLVDFYLNGVKFEEGYYPIQHTAKEFKFPVGALHAGYNTLTVSNATPSSVMTPHNDWASINIDYHRFELLPPPPGMSIIVR